MTTPTPIEREIKRLECYIHSVRSGFIPSTPGGVTEAYREISRLRELERQTVEQVLER